MVGGSRLRQIGWAMALSFVFTLFIALTFRVNAVKSEVVRAERHIVALKKENMRLVTEFETRANQQQLASWNAVDFGYVAPRADQYLESERQLADLSQPVSPDAPAPIRVARASGDDELPQMVSPMTGKPMEPAPASYDKPEGSSTRKDMQAKQRDRDRPSLADRLGMSVHMPAASPDVGPNAKVSE